MGTTRRLAREAALQALYSLDTKEDWSQSTIQEFVHHFLRNNLAEKNPSLIHLERDDQIQFCEHIILGVTNHLSEIDNIIEEAATRWTVDRMARIDRNILRMGVFELLFCSDIPSKVAINEAIEIAKRFGAHDSPNFINGVLDRVMKVMREREDEKTGSG